MRYVDRADAGRQLVAAVDAALRQPAVGDGGALVLGIPRGGVVVGGEIAAALSLDLDVALARKVGAPHNPELAIGAIGEDGAAVLDDDLVARLGVSRSYLQTTIESERAELQRRSRSYRGDRNSPEVAGRAVVLVDDGIATGATLQATVETLRRQHPRWLACVAPVGAPDSVDRIDRRVDLMICPLRPRAFRAVGEWYESFTQTTDAEVVTILAMARARGTDA